MGITVLCMACFLLGFFTGRKSVSKDIIFRYAEKIMFVLVIFLVFLLGTMIGTDEKVISSLGSIGIISFVLAVFAMSGSAVAITILRKFLKMNRMGVRND